MLRICESYLDISPFLVEDVVDTVISLTADEFHSIKKAFRVGSGKVELPKTRLDLLPIYCKCVNQLFSWLIGSSETRVRQGDSRGKVEVTYHSTGTCFLVHTFDLMKLQSPLLTKINKQIVAAAYDEAANENKCIKLYGTREAPRTAPRSGDNH